MKNLRFQWIGNRHYSVVLYFGENFVPVEDDLLRLLEKECKISPEKFLEQVVERIGSNPYLKEKIRAAAEAGDPGSRIPAMQEFIHKLRL
ncbi:MAG: hypothetical protein HY283_06635 [Nitrospirae bacterium]|nr:hypothetical protein [Nitrospirota bacterium]